QLLAGPRVEVELLLEAPGPVSGERGAPQPTPGHDLILGPRGRSNGAHHPVRGACARMRAARSRPDCRTPGVRVGRVGSGCRGGAEGEGGEGRSQRSGEPRHAVSVSARASHTFEHVFVNLSTGADGCTG